jgi:Fanconi anemia group D2 protein
MASPVSSGSKRPADNTDQPSKVVKQLGRSTPLAEIEHNTAGDTANGLFMSTIAAAGFDLWGDSEQHVMKSDVHTFARKCSKVLHHRPEAVLEFRRDFEKYVDDSAQLLKSLRPWRSTGDTTVVYSQQETLIKLLLGIDSLQPSLLDVLLEKLAEHSCGEENVTVALIENIPRLILGQIRWLDRLVDGPAFVVNLLAMMDTIEDALQREIVLALPEIIDDDQHETVVTHFQELMQNNPAFMAPVLDALINLNLNCDLMTAVHRFVLSRLQSVELSDLPLLVKFLLHTADPESSASIINGIRSLNVMGLSVHSVGGDGGQRQSSSETMLVESIRSGLRSNMKAADSFVSTIQSSNAHSTIDIWILLVQHSLPGSRSKIENTFKKQTQTGCFTPELMHQAIECSNGALCTYFENCKAIADLLVRAADSGCRKAGQTMYVAMFRSFSEDFHRQDVLSAIITHTGSSQQREMDAALEALHILSSNECDCRHVRRYLTFVQNVMDYMESFKDQQIRTLYKIFCNLSLTEMRMTGIMPEDDHIHIVLKKQLSHPDLLYKRMGILGATTLIGSFSRKSEQGQLPQPQVRYVTTMLDLLLESCRSNPACLALAYDELSQALEELVVDQRIVSNIFDKVSEEFEGSYLLDLDEGCVLVPAPMPADVTLTSMACMNLDHSNAVIVLNILPLVASNNSQERDLLTTMCSIFRLLVTTTKLMNAGSVLDIDAVLGCPLYLFGINDGECVADCTDVSDDVFCCFLTELTSSECEIVTSCLFFAANWIRELLNGFCAEDGADMKVKTRQRLRHLVQIESKLDICLASVVVDLPNLNRPTTNAPRMQGSSSNKAKRKGKQTGDPDAPSGKQLPTYTPKVADHEAIRRQEHFDAYAKPNMRELLVHASLLIEGSDFTSTHLSTEDQQVNVDEICMIKEPPLLHYMLDDLRAKLAFMTQPVKNNPFGNSPSGELHPSLARYTSCNAIEILLPALNSFRKHMTSIALMVQRTNSTLENHNEDHGQPSTYLVYWMDCLVKIVQCLSSLLHSDMYSMDQPRRQLCKILGCLANSPDSTATVLQVSGDQASRKAFAVACSDAFSYLEDYASKCESPVFAFSAVKLMQQLTKVVRLHADDAHYSQLCRSRGNLEHRLSTLTGSFLETHWQIFGGIQKVKKTDLADIIRVHILMAEVRDTCERIRVRDLLALFQRVGLLAKFLAGARILLRCLM